MRAGLELSLQRYDEDGASDFLNGGEWDGKQHLPKEFVKTATSPLVRTRPTNHYGYFWWSQNHEINGVQYPSAQGRGAGGQLFFVFPTIDLVVTATAHNQGMGTVLVGIA